MTHTVLLDAFRAMFDALRASPNVELLKAHDRLKAYAPSINERFAEEIRQQTGLAPGPELVACMNASNGTTAWWRYRLDDGRHGSGEFSLVHLRDAFLSDPPPLWTDETPPERVAFLQQLRVLDSRPETGDDKFAAFRLPPPSEAGEAPPEIWYWDRGDCTRMEIDYRGYLEALVLTKGVPDWQYLFCSIDPADPLRRGLHDRLERQLDALAALFPAHDDASLRDRLDRMPR